jgi:hypothetical protein
MRPKKPKATGEGDCSRQGSTRSSVECIGKGKAAAPYEFGVKASIVTTNSRAGRSVRASRQGVAGQSV